MAAPGSGVFALPPQSQPSASAMPPYRSQATSGQPTATRPDAYDLSNPYTSPALSRSPSSATSIANSDRASNFSTLTSAFPSNPTNVRPAPAYVAKPGASQVVSEYNALRRPSDSDSGNEADRTGETVFSESALGLVNAFLDQLLYSFLSQARSASLAALRPAVVEVLKARLAREAVAAAEEELSEMLDGGEEDSDGSGDRTFTLTNANGSANGNGKESSMSNYRPSWDLELVWKRTRLRVMVYMRLGEMEDDDEERYVKEEELFQGSERRFSRSNGLVSWAAAIFLTSILEYVAEQTLQTAGKAANARVLKRARAGAGDGDSQGLADREQTVVEDFDVEKVALSPTLGRLWRSWRKALRSNNAAAGTSSKRSLRTPSRDNLLQGHAGRARSTSLGTPIGGASAVNDEESQHTRWGSVGGMGVMQSTTKEDPDVPDVQHPEHVLAANIPLPMGEKDRDVDEIEVPGLAKDSDVSEAESEAFVEPKSRARRNSLSSGVPVGIASTKERGIAPGIRAEGNQKFREQPVKPGLSRKRSKSVPVAPIRVRRSIMPGAFPEEPSPSPTKSSSAKDDQSPVETRARIPDLPNKRRSLEPKARKDYGPLPPDPAPNAAARQRLPRADSEKFDAAAMAPFKRKSLPDLLSQTAATTLDPAQDSELPTTTTSFPRASSRDVVDSDRRKSAYPASALNWTIYGSKAKSGWNTSMPDLRAPSKPRGNGVKDVEELDKRKAVVGKEEKDKRLSVPTAAFSKGRGRSAEAGTSDVRSTSAEVGREGREESQDSRTTDQSYVLGTEEQRRLAGAAVKPPGLFHERTESGPKELEDTSVTAENAKSSGSIFIPGSKAVDSQQARDAAATPTPKASDTSNSQASYFGAGTIAAAAATAGLAAAGLAGTVKSADDSGNEASSSGVDAFLKSRNLGNRNASGPTTPVAEIPPPRERAKSSPKVAHQSPRLATREARPNVPLTNGAQHSPVGAALSTPKRQSWSAAAEKQAAVELRPKSTPITPVEPRAPASSTEVKEHPALQRMTSLKRNENKAALAALEKGSRNTNDGSNSPALTSASIKGPEDFDMFVQGEDTVKYTLTPSNVRDQPPKATPYTPSYMRNQATAGARTSTPPLTPIDTNTAASPARERGRRASSKYSTATITAGTIPSDPHATPQEKEKRRRSVSKPSVRNTSTSRHGQTAREPRVMTDSTRDLSDFIRSTGPGKETQPTPLVNPANRSTTSLASTVRSASTGPVPRSPSSSTLNGGEDERTKSLTRNQMISQNIPPVPTLPSTPSSTGKKKSSMQARAASGSQGGSANTNELIDFIRSGPQQPDEHRISRSVAPFRSTMDSDQFAGMGMNDTQRQGSGEKPGLRLDTSIGQQQPTARMPIGMAKSPKSSRAPSRSGGGGSGGSGAVRPAYSSSQTTRSPVSALTPATATPGGARTKPKTSAPTPVAENADPTRKRYRNKDPYAIDFSDEDDEDEASLTSDNLTALPTQRSRPRREESLMDFLNSHEPPADNGPRALSMSNTARNNSRPAMGASNASNSSSSQQQKSNMARPSSRTSAASAQPPGPVTGAYRGPRMQARAAASGQAGAKRLGAFHDGGGSNTRDLADFLRNSEPPETGTGTGWNGSGNGMGAPPPPSIGNKISGPEEVKGKKRGFWGSLGRRRTFADGSPAGKGGGKKTWLDMP